MWREILIALVAAILLSWLAMVVALVIIRPKGNLLGESLRILPDLIRLLKRLTADPSLSRGIRVRLGLLMVYLVLPIDLIPDFIPVLGYADDAIVVVAVLRSVVRRVGTEPLRAAWPGTPDVQPYRVSVRKAPRAAARPTKTRPGSSCTGGAADYRWAVGDHSSGSPRTVLITGCRPRVPRAGLAARRLLPLANDASCLKIFPAARLLNSSRRATTRRTRRRARPARGDFRVR